MPPATRAALSWEVPRLADTRSLESVRNDSGSAPYFSWSAS